MKHNIRQRQLDKNGLMTTKVVKVEGELGSRVLDINGKEIFEGDRVQFRDEFHDCTKTWDVTFSGGHFRKGHLLLGHEDNVEIVGHVED